VVVSDVLGVLDCAGVEESFVIVVPAVVVGVAEVVVPETLLVWTTEVVPAVAVVVVPGAVVVVPTGVVFAVVVVTTLLGVVVVALLACLFANSIRLWATSAFSL
jgi:hypothetical protein